MEPNQTPAPAANPNPSTDNQPVVGVQVQSFDEPAQPVAAPIVTPTTPVAASAQPTVGGPKHPKLWPTIFIILGLLQLLAVVIWIAVIKWAVGQAKQGVSGTEFIPFLLLPLVYAASVVALISVIGLPIFLIKRRPKVIWIVLSILSLLLSGFIVYVGARNFYELKVVIPRENRKSEQQIRQLDQELKNKYNL